MPWFKVDDTFPHHAKVLTAGNAAVGLWVRAGAWSMQQLTDGYVPKHVAQTMGTRAEAGRLVDAGLWQPVEGGYQFHEWEQRQPSKVDVLSERESNRRRADLHRDPELRDAVRKRDRDRCRYCGISVDFKARRGPTRGTYDHVDPEQGNTFANLVVSCGPCNSSKGHRTPEQWGRPLLEPGSLGAAFRIPVLDEFRNGSRTNQDPDPTRPSPSTSTPAIHGELDRGPA